MMVRSSTAASWHGHIWGRIGHRGTIRDQRLGTVHSQPGNPGTGRASPCPRATTHHRRSTGAVPAQYRRHPARSRRQGRPHPACHPGGRSRGRPVVESASPGGGRWVGHLLRPAAVPAARSPRPGVAHRHRPARTPRGRTTLTSTSGGRQLPGDAGEPPLESPGMPLTRIPTRTTP